MTRQHGRRNNQKSLTVDRITKLLPWTLSATVTVNRESVDHTANKRYWRAARAKNPLHYITQWTDVNHLKPWTRSVEMSKHSMRGLQSCGPEMLQAIDTCTYVVVVDVARAHYHRCPIANRDVCHRVIWRLDTGESTKQDKPMVIF